MLTIWSFSSNLNLIYKKLQDNVLDNVFERFGLKLSELKTETMILNSTEPVD